MLNKYITADGNFAAAYIAYAFTEIAAIYPITPSSNMAEQMDKFRSEHKKNIFDSEVELIEMQSEAGAAGAIHGALSAGSLATTFTSSQGLLLMIPNMYKMAGELLPSVIHVAARTVATHALSIFGDHSDVYACRQTGYAMVCSNSPQEVVHMALLSHLSAISSRVPFMHFFDGFRTSHEIQKINIPDYEIIKNMLDWDKYYEFKNRGLNPENPVMRGTAQNDDVYFQNREACNIYYENSVKIIEQNLNKINGNFNTNYDFFEYYGNKNPDRIIIAMGSVCETIEEVIDCLKNNENYNIGLLKVRVYRPFNIENLINKIPSSVKKITVLDRTKEPGSVGEPLYLDINTALNKYKHKFNNIEIFSGRYGLSSKNTTPEHIISIYDNMNSDEPKRNFTVGITDDVTNLSLEIKNNVNLELKGCYNCEFWGMGSDGTVGASKNTIKIIGDHTDFNIQGFFSYDSKKSGGTTVSHLRFGKNKIKSTYNINKADFIGIYKNNYIYKYNILKDLKENGIVLLNSNLNNKELLNSFAPEFKQELIKKNAKLYVLDANKISAELGLGGRINTALQSAFFKITNIFNSDEALGYIKESIYETYHKKGEKVVEINYKCAEQGMKEVRKVEIFGDSAQNNNYINNAQKQEFENKKLESFVQNIASEIDKKNGDNLPVSAFLPYVDGTIPLGSSQYEKRATASFVPDWIPENCIQCNLCSYVCPHAVIRPFVFTQQDLDNMHENLKSKLKYKNMLGMPGYYFSINISVQDCTGCGNCTEICPGMRQNKALKLINFDNNLTKNQEIFNYFRKIKSCPEVNIKFPESTVKGSQFKQPLLEFSGACAGCGETPYAKLVTQLFGDRMIIANATGCSSIWGASFPSSPYAANHENRGPAWHNSLFEDNAEFGLGIALSHKHSQNNIINKIKYIFNNTQNIELKKISQECLENLNNSKLSQYASRKLTEFLENYNNSDISDEIINYILRNKNSVSTKSVWIFGGDGWAYDIGFGGLDHVLASGENVNILVFDTEVYSNTGGQASKSTPENTVAKFAISGKKTPKKDLAQMAMSYKNVYVAQISLGADYNQCIKALIEAESYNGPSIVIAYCPCINHGISGGMKNSLKSAKLAVQSGHWKLFRYDPRNSCLTKDSSFEEDNTEKIHEFISTQARYKLPKD